MPAKTLPFIYREEILRTFFDYVKRGESFYIIGAPSAGKTRFLDLVLGNDPDALRVGSEYDQEWIKKKYLGEETASKVWLIRVDMNRITKGENWDFQFYELLLSSILLACTENRLTNNIDTIFGELTDLNSQVLKAGGEPLPGLFAAGEVAGFGGGGYHGYNALEGTFLGGCIFSGRAAGRAV